MAQINERLPDDWREARPVLSNFMRFMGAEYDLVSSKNIQASIRFASNGATQVAVPHGLNGIPLGWSVIDKEGLGDIYRSASSDRTNLYFKSDVIGVYFTIAVF